MLRDKHLRALARAVSMAEDWRGAIVGNPDPGPLAKFDKDMAEAREALREVRSLYKTMYKKSKPAGG